MYIEHTITEATVTVVILTYGDYTWLERTVESVLQQDYPIQTIILSDDGSGIPFPQKIKHRLTQCNIKTIIRSNKDNLGTTAHMNATAKLCHSDYIKFIAVGDAFSDTAALRALITFAQEKRTLVITSNSKVTSENLKRAYYHFPGSSRGKRLNTSSSKLYSLLAVANIVSAAGTLFDTAFFDMFGGFNEQYRLLEDWPTWLRLARNGESIPFLNRVTCYYTVGGVSSEHGNAFLSEKLRDDMKLCYEQEILPYLSYFSKQEKRSILHLYEKLAGVETAYIWKKYFLLELKVQLKSTIKQCLLRVCRKKRYSAV